MQIASFEPSVSCLQYEQLGYARVGGGNKGRESPGVGSVDMVGRFSDITLLSSKIYTRKVKPGALA